MSTKKMVKVGIFSGYDPRPWVMKDCAENDIKVLDGLVKKLRSLRKYEIVYPGEKMKGYDKLCYNMRLANIYAEEFVKNDVAAVINVHQTWTFPQLSQKVLTNYINKMKAKDGNFVPRIILASIQDTQVPGMVSGMATGGALAQIGVNYSHVCGYFDSPKMLKELDTELELYAKMAEKHNQIKTVVNNLHKEHIVEFGSFSLQMPTTRIDYEDVMSKWGVSFENLDQQVFLDRAFEMFEWTGTKGKSVITEVLDKRVDDVLKKVYDKCPEKFSAIPERIVSREKFALQVAVYFAVLDITKEKSATAVTIKCQDECSAKYATCCIATSFLGNNTDLTGKNKTMYPISCETDNPTLISQMLLTRISGKPAGFGDFRYVKTDGNKTLLAIVNCGQHPLYYAGKETDSWSKKFNQVEFPGQEHFYAAGGSAVRMRTDGGQKVTVARLGVSNGRLYLAGTVMNTINVAKTRHNIYNKAWPIIEGYVPTTDSVLSKKWPSNHLGFVYGDYIPELIELAEQLGIGYIIWPENGKEYYKMA